MVDQDKKADINFIQLTFATVSLIKRDIIYAEFKNTQSIKMEDVVKLNNARLTLSKGQAFYSLVSLASVFGSMTKPAQNYLANDCESSDLILHETIIVNSLPIRILVHYYIKTFKPKFEITVVKDFESGIKTLRTIQEGKI